jgi:ribosomal protein S9
MLREMLERERETVQDLRERLTRAELLLTDQRTKPRKSFWSFFS